MENTLECLKLWGWSCPPTPYADIEGLFISSWLMGKGVMDEQPQHSEFAIECFFSFKSQNYFGAVLGAFASL